MSCCLGSLVGRGQGLASGITRMRRSWLSKPLPKRRQHHSPASDIFLSAMLLCHLAPLALIVVCTHHQVWQQDGPLLLRGRCRARTAGTRVK